MTLRNGKYVYNEKNWKERQMLLLNIQYFELEMMNDWVYSIQRPYRPLPHGARRNRNSSEGWQD